MRLRSEPGDARYGNARGTVGGDLSAQSDHSFALLPEQAAAVRKLQAETGATFDSCALELGYVPASPARRAQQSNDQLADQTETADLDPLIVMMSDPSDPVGSAARELRSVIGAMRTADGSPVKRVALLSLQARAETSVLAANYAVACALSGQQTLLIDANLEAPTQHGLFRRNGKQGVSQVLMARVDVENVIQATAVPGLDLIASGVSDEATIELTERNALAIATELASENYDVVVVDVGEANQIGISCAGGFDGSVVVVQRGVTPLRDVRKLVDRLRSGGDSPVGAVVAN